MKRVRALGYIVLLCFVTLCITTYFLYTSRNQVRQLNNHKKVLMNRLSEEAHQTRVLKKENDSLKRALRQNGELHNLEKSTSR